MSEESKETTGQATSGENQLVGSKAIPPETQQTKTAAQATPSHHESQPSSSHPSSRDADDDDEASDSPANGVIQLPIASFTRRVQRETKKNLRELFGTDNLSEILEMKKALDSYRTREEDERKKNLAEIERIREEAAADKRAREQAEERVSDLENERLALNYDEHVRDIASKFIKPKYYRHVAGDLREYLIEEFGDDEESLKGVTSKTIAQFFKGYVEENPEYALEEKTVPVTNGVSATRPGAPPSGSVSGKTAKPGMPNSMTSSEYHAMLKQRGLSY